MTIQLVTTAVSVLVSLLVTSLYRHAIKRINETLEAFDKRMEEQKRIKEATLSLLRQELDRKHAAYIRDGYCGDDKKQKFQALYEKYNALGGNGLISQYYEEIIRLPLTPEEKNAHENAHDRP